MKRALICGVGGQDGAYLAKLLLAKGYEVVGTSRDADTTPFTNLERLGILEHVSTVSMRIDDYHSVQSIVSSTKPDEIYNLAGQSSVGLSFDHPVETMEGIVCGTMNLLESIRAVESSIRIFNAGSGECFGEAGQIPVTESSPFHPHSPYAVAKTAAHNLVKTYREAYGMFACTGILFNHESPLRSKRFVTKKIVCAAADIFAGQNTKLQLGNLDVYRDWGWAEEYVEAMWLMLQQEAADDYIIATGKTVSLEYFVEKAFAYFNLNWKDHTEIDAAHFRLSDAQYISANPEKANKQLMWRSTVGVEEVINRLCKDASEAR
ncbi:GDP-mannose 4,6-dehydratase [Sideroxyarcus emersonii]|nr:GDP-mannose 4,6-dehydratase [Sideroxyarcus emersonii]